MISWEVIVSQYSNCSWRLWFDLDFVGWKKIQGVFLGKNLGFLPCDAQFRLLRSI
jgi:hypothetical protein